MANLTGASQVYGGDEVGALVLDPGTYSTRAGYAGEDVPRFIIPSSYAIRNQTPEQPEELEVKQEVVEPAGEEDDDVRAKKRVKRDYIYFGDEQIHIPREDTEIKSIVNDEVIEDWDMAIRMFDYLFKELNADIEEQPVLLTEPVWNSKANKLKSLEVFLEHFNVPGFYLMKAPACTSFAVGRPNSLIVDIGHNVTSVTPVLDGMCLSRNTMKTHYAGRFLDSQLRSAFAQRNIDIVPRFKVKSKQPVKYSLEQLQNQESVKPIYQAKTSLPKTITASFENYETQRIFNEMKESLLVVPETPISDAQKFDYQSRYFELPNGLQVEFEKERYQIANSLFDPLNYVTHWKSHPELHFTDDLQWEEENGELADLDIDNDYVPLKRGKKKDPAEESAAKDNADDGDADGIASRNKGTNGKLARAKNMSSDVRGLSALINQTLANVDVDIRQQVAHNIVVTGSLSLIPGLNDRIHKDLNELNPGLKIRLHSSGNTSERKCQNWIGGSIVASLGTFHQLWVSKQEYEEVGGDRLIIERFR